ncbi:hypothetical protein GQ457_18G014130 [Hibiscus cannabinus]
MAHIDCQHEKVATGQVNSPASEDLDGLNLAVNMPEFEAEHFELKLVIFNTLNTLGQFGGSSNENVKQRLKSFLKICNSFKLPRFFNDVLKLKLFLYSLRDRAILWLNNLSPSLLQSWTELCHCFLARFSYNNMTENLRNKITSFRQEDDESIGLKYQIFYNSINTPTRMMFDASANGTLLDKPPREGLEILEKLAQNDYQHPTTRKSSMRR